MMKSASSESQDDDRFSSQYLNHAEENPDTVVLETTDDFFCRKRTFNQTQSWNFSFWQNHRSRLIYGLPGNLTAVYLRKWLCHFTADPQWKIRKLEVDTIFFKGNLSESLFNRISKLSRWFLTKKLGNTRSRVANFTSGAKTQSRSKTFFLIGIKILWSSHPPAPQYFSGWRIESFSCFGRKGELSNNFFTIIPNIKSHEEHFSLQPDFRNLESTCWRKLLFWIQLSRQTVQAPARPHTLRRCALV